jgi:hypothetical protein
MPPEHRADAGISHQLHEAKGELRRAENAWQKARNAYWPMVRSRRAIDPLAEPSEAELRARQAYDAAGAALSEARERMRGLSVLLAQEPKPRRKKPRPDETDAGDDSP